MWMNDTWDVRCDEETVKQTLTLARSRAPDHFIFWKLRTPSVTNHINRGAS